MTDLTDRARAFALHAHAGQRRKSLRPTPYAVHLFEVADFVTRHGGDEIAIAAAWLHDTVEDCGTAPETLARDFGPAVAAVVAELTDDKSLSKQVRKDAQVASAPRKSARAVLVKLGDKASNTASVGLAPGHDWSLGRRRAYLDWAETVIVALPTPPAAALAETMMLIARSRTLLNAEAALERAA